MLTGLVNDSRSIQHLVQCMSCLAWKPRCSGSPEVETVCMRQGREIPSQWELSEASVPFCSKPKNAL